MMISIKDLFSEMPMGILDNQRKINVDAKINVYYGFNKNGGKRISFLSSCRPYTIESTKLIDVLQLSESENVYWTCFDLVDNNAESVYYSLIEDLIKSIIPCVDELSCLKEIKNRFLIWKKMLGRAVVNGMTEEKVRGIFGELYFLYNYLKPKYTLDSSVKAWGGPDGDSKDFTIDNQWYEVKAVGTSTNEVKITSLIQLDSDVAGDLAIVRIEAMSDAYEDGMSSLEDLVSLILREIDDQAAKDLFVGKLDKLKYTPLDNAVRMKFKAHSINLYLVDNDFPRITAKDIKYAEIDKVAYSIYIKAIEKFKDVR